MWYAGLLGRWDKQLIDQASDVLSIIFFFIISYRALKTLYFNFCKIIKNKKINWIDFCSRKNNTWNIRRLVDEAFVPATQHIILKIVGFLIV